MLIFQNNIISPSQVPCNEVLFEGCGRQRHVCSATPGGGGVRGPATGVLLCSLCILSPNLDALQSWLATCGRKCVSLCEWLVTCSARETEHKTALHRGRQISNDDGS